MYPVSQDYINKLKEMNVEFKAIITVYHSKGILTLTHENIGENSLIFKDSSQSGEDFNIGGVVASDISFTILNSPEYDDIQFIGAMLECNIGVKVEEGIDSHFLQPSQPSKMKGFDDRWEYVSLGKFNIDIADRKSNTIQIGAIDNMIKLDKPYSLSKLSYPATLYQIYTNICNVSDTIVGTVNFPNMHYSVKEKPSGNFTLRDVLGFVAELSGTFSKVNRNGAIELKWYKDVDLVINPNLRSSLIMNDDLIKITGISYTTEDTIYITGEEGYVIDLTENPLLQGGYENLLPNILANVESTIFNPYETKFYGNPAIEVGDRVIQNTIDGNEIKSIITSMEYKFRGTGTLKAEGLPEISRGFKGSTDKRIAEIKRQVIEDIGDELTNLEQAQLNATDLLANMLGGYLVKDTVDEGIFYIADNPDITKAMKVWKYGIGGFGYSSTGVNGIYTTAVTADGSIVAMLVSANIINANMIIAGILESKDGSTWLNLDNGEFSLANGSVIINKDKVRVNHGSSGEYSEINAQGFFKQYLYGVGNYLNDMHIYQGLYNWSPTLSRPSSLIIGLPDRFKGRPDTKIMIIPRTMEIKIEGFHLINDNVTITKILDAYILTSVDDIVINDNTAYVEVSAYIESFAEDSNEISRRIYSPITFDIIAIGE